MGFQDNHHLKLQIKYLQFFAVKTPHLKLEDLGATTIYDLKHTHLGKKAYNLNQLSVQQRNVHIDQIAYRSKYVYVF